mmetsp:Transcript_11884/g.17704  ORF Transcript_11884/g.17704 Transcript_11884/m.17704 type:complete len:165 (-) Transcript_11884:9-503(-)
MTPSSAQKITASIPSLQPKPTGSDSSGKPKRALSMMYSASLSEFTFLPDTMSDRNDSMFLVGQIRRGSMPFDMHAFAMTSCSNPGPTSATFFGMSLSAEAICNLTLLSIFLVWTGTTLGVKPLTPLWLRVARAYTMHIKNALILLFPNHHRYQIDVLDAGFIKR